MPMKMIKDTKAVSTVVSSLLLIMVVAGGAAFLSSMMRNVGSQADDAIGKTSSADITAMKLNIVSSDLAQPAVEALVKAYNDKHTGVMLQLQQGEMLNGTSNVSISALATGIADIGATDRLPFPDEMGKYPDLAAQKFGISGIVVIVNNGAGGTFSKSDLTGYYDGTNISLKAHQITGSSGMQQAFMQYLGNPSISSSISAVSGSSGMLDAVKNNNPSIGFIEYGYVNSQVKRGQDVFIADLQSSGQTYTNLSYSNFTLAASSSYVNNSDYPLELAHTLYFVTRGNPSLVDSFIKWARSSEGQDILEKNGYISYMREFN